MRELKFRAWLDEYKQYIYFGGDYKEQTGRWGKGRCALLGDNYIAELYANEDNSNMFYQVHKVECIEQYTGLKDKNGKEIYEGDIVKSSYRITGDSEPTYSYHLVEWGVQSMDDYCGDITVGLWLPDDNEAIEVVGNIHENPDLLEEK